MAKHDRGRWNSGTLLPFIDGSVNQLCARKTLIDETSGCWSFIHHGSADKNSHLDLLKLKLSRRKTKIGFLTRGFHFLSAHVKINADACASDVKEPVAQTQHSKFHVTVALHERGHIRAMSKIAVMKADAVHPAYVQSYLAKWSTWWRKTASPISQRDILTRFKQRAAIHQPDLCWLVNGLLWQLGHRCSLGNVRAA